MNRLAVVTFFGGLIAAAPLTDFARAQNNQCKPAAPGIRVIGFLTGGAPESVQQNVVSFRQGLMDSGYVEDRNIVIDYRWGYAANLDRIARDLVNCAPTLIFAAGSTPAAKAAQNITTTIPIVFAVGLDPVKTGLVMSYERPALNGNITGVTMRMATGLQAQRDLLLELNPGIKKVGLLVNANAPPPDADDMVKVLPDGKKFEVLSDEQLRGDIFRQAADEGYDGMIVSGDQFFATRRTLIIGQAATHKIATLYPLSKYVDAGGLISYGGSSPNTYRQAGLYVGKILNGASPNSLPVLTIQPELAINLNTARALSLPVRTELRARADKIVGNN